MKFYLTPFVCSMLMLYVITDRLQASPAADRDDPYLTRTFTVGNEGELLVETSGGSISVSGENSEQVIVEMFVRKNDSWLNWFGSDEDVEESLEDYDIDIRQKGRQVLAIAKRKGSNWKNNQLSISFHVRVPRNMSTELSTSGGSISLRNLQGEQQVKTSGGSLNFEQLSGNTSASTSGGSIHVERYEGILDASTSGGSIHLSDATGELKVHTSGGSVVINDVSGSVEASTSGGSIKADIADLGEYLMLHTSGGSVSATVPQGLGLNLELSGNRVNTQLHNFSGESRDNYVRGSMNGGGIPVKMSTSGGSVNLDFRMHAAR